MQIFLQNRKFLLVDSPDPALVVGVEAANVVGAAVAAFLTDIVLR